MAAAAAVAAVLLSGVEVRAATTSGAPDPTFSEDGIAEAPLMEGRVWSTVVQPDGRIVVAGSSGWAFTFGEPSDFAVLRFTPDGRLDPSFGGDGMVTIAFASGAAQAHGVALQPDGRIVAAGCTGCDWTGASDVAVARLNPDGSLDPSFGAGGRIDGIPIAGPDACGVATRWFDGYDVGVQSTGRIVVGGFFGPAVPGATYDFGVAGFTTAGDLDCTFGAPALPIGDPSPVPAGVGVGGGVVTTDFGNTHDLAFAMAVGADDAIVVGGTTDSGGYGSAGVVRYTADGVADVTFGRAGRAVLPYRTSYRAIQGVTVLAGGGVAATGQVAGNRGHVAVGVLTARGEPDPTFGSDGVVAIDPSPGIQSNENGYGIVEQADGRLVVTGEWSSGLGLEYRRRMLALRLDRTGALDRSFGIDGLAGVGIPYSGADVAVQPDGGIVTTGTATRPVVRLLP